MKVPLLLLLALFIPFASRCQTGPGGAGDTATSSGYLHIWFDANDLDGNGIPQGMGEPVLTGSSINSWKSKVRNGIAGTASTTQPTFTLSGNNGYPQVNFNWSPTNFETGVIANRGANETIFCVSTIMDGQYNTVYNAGNSNLRRLYSNTNTTPDTHLCIGGGTAKNNVPGPGAANTTITKAVFAPAPINSSLQVNQNTPVTGTAGSSANGMTLRIGWLNASSYFNGNISELIIFSDVVTEVQSIIIHNYLSAKYDVPLTSLDLYKQDEVANGNFDHDVAGIGEDALGNTQTAAKGTGIVTINGAQGLDADEYLIWGHNANAQTFSETVDIPSGVQYRLARVWRANEVNAASTPVDVGAVNISWDLTGIPGVSVSNLRLLVDTDNDGSFADETPIMAGVTNPNRNTYTFAAVTALANNLRFTLAIDNIVLPVRLMSFEAAPFENRQVKLKWETASEFNNKYFTVERSKENLKWQPVAKLNGVGNSTQSISYTYTDNDPVFGVSYYRLRQTDINGYDTYSPTRSVKLMRAADKVVIYPNPAIDRVVIEGSKEEISTIAIYDAMGRNVTSSAKVTVNNNGQLSLDVSFLTSGVYNLKTVTQSTRLSIQ